MKKTLLLFAIFSLSLSAVAQEFPFGQVTADELEMKRYNKDTSAHAVVLNEYGSARIHFDNDYHVVITYTYHTKIKFFDSKDFEREGAFAIPVYASSDNTHYDDVDDIKGLTTYKDDNGRTQQTELDPKKVFTVKETKRWSLLKFVMPGLRNGCIIDVSYRVVSPYLFNFHTWNFQGHIPRINSEYEVHIPGFWAYNASLKGYLKLTTNKAVVERGCFTYGSAIADCSDITYGITDVPAFIDEEYMTSENNYKSSVSFQLVEETDLNNGGKTKYTSDWKNLDYLLKQDHSFGSQLKRKSLMKEKTVSVIANKTDELEKARAIYTYIKNTIKWNERDDYSSDDGISNALDNHTGNSGDINLALVTALNAGGISAEAVMISTRTHGSLNKLYPNLDNFNYTIAKANIGDKCYFLDATEPLLPFGMLPLRCLNDQGRVFSLDKPSYWIDITTGQSDNTTYALDLTLQDNGKLKGTIKRYSLGYSAYLRRKEIKKFNSTDEYVESVGEKLHHTKILKSNIENIDSLDNPVSETYEIEMNIYDDTHKDRLSFNPYILNRLVSNPFKLAERDFPVDWGMPSDDRYVVTIHLPAQYTIENLPQAISFAMPNQGGNFSTAFDGDKQNFTFSYNTRFNKSVYVPEEYPYLKELYNKIILTEKNEIVFKKK